MTIACLWFWLPENNPFPWWSMKVFAGQKFYCCLQCGHFHQITKLYTFKTIWLPCVYHSTKHLLNGIRWLYYLSWSLLFIMIISRNTSAFSCPKDLPSSKMYLPRNQNCFSKFGSLSPISNEKHRNKHRSYVAGSKISTHFTFHKLYSQITFYK